MDYYSPTGAFHPAIKMAAMLLRGSVFSPADPRLTPALAGVTRDLENFTDVMQFFPFPARLAASADNSAVSGEANEDGNNFKPQWASPSQDDDDEVEAGAIYETESSLIEDQKYDYNFEEYFIDDILQPPSPTLSPSMSTKARRITPDPYTLFLFATCNVMYCTNYVQVEDTVILLYSGNKILKGHNLDTVLEQVSHWFELLFYILFTLTFMSNLHS